MPVCFVVGSVGFTLESVAALALRKETQLLLVAEGPFNDGVRSTDGWPLVCCTGIQWKGKQKLCYFVDTLVLDGRMDD